MVIGTFLGGILCLRAYLSESSEKESHSLSWTEYLEKNYLERIRRYSHPAKAFEKFASVTVDGKKLMSVDDLVYMLLGKIIAFPGVCIDLSLTLSSIRNAHYTNQPEDKSLKAKQLLSAREFLKKFDTTGDRLQVPIEHMKQSFVITDLNDDNYLSREELRNFLKSNCKFVDYFHRMGYIEYRECLNKDSNKFFNLFFGNDGHGKMKYNDFIDFLEELKTNILKLEFYRFDVDEKTDSISSADFIRALLTYNPTSRLDELNDKINDLKDGPRVTFEMYEEFDKSITRKASSIEFACKLCPALIPKCDSSCLKRIFHKIAGTKLSDQQIGVIFHICRRVGKKSDELDCNMFYDLLVKGRLYKGYSHS